MERAHPRTPPETARDDSTSAALTGHLQSRELPGQDEPGVPRIPGPRRGPPEERDEATADRLHVHRIFDRDARRVRLSDTSAHVAPAIPPSGVVDLGRDL